MNKADTCVQECEKIECEQEQILTKNGCEFCATGFKPSFNKRQCVQMAICNSRQFRNEDGNCEYCKNREIVSKNGLSCVKIQCNFNERKTASGLCVKCPVCTAVKSTTTKDDDGEDVTKDTCDANTTCTGNNFVLSLDGSCTKCADYTKRLGRGGQCGRGTCQTPNCGGNYKITKEGECEACGSGKKVKSNRIDCEDVTAC